MFALPLLFLLRSLFLCGHVEAQSSTTDILKHAALQWGEPLQCEKWDCQCAFTRQRGCCCAALDMYKIEDDTFMRIKHLWRDISHLKYGVHELIDNYKISFEATISDSPGLCLGRFNTNLPISYNLVRLNDGYGYNPSYGIFTAPLSGVYVFSVTVYSSVAKGQRLYHSVQLMLNGVVVVSVWEDNREDGEDSATQVVILALKRGDQVYAELMSGRRICNHLQYNIFTGYMLYPDTDDYE